jgi:hypothetical protein
MPALFFERVGALSVAMIAVGLKSTDTETQQNPRIFEVLA